jgi:hypothetical protein
MSETRLLRYLLSCGLLTVPILVWNVVFTRFLPLALGSKECSRNIPPLVGYGETILRFAVVLLPFLMPLEAATVIQRRGLFLFIVGTIVYFLAWVALMIFPQSRWSTSLMGSIAPTYTPLIWLTGLGIMGRRLFWPSPYRWWMYIALAFAFVVFHVTHAGIVSARNYLRISAGGASD